MRHVAVFLRWIIPLVLTLLVLFAVLQGCRRALVSAASVTESDGLVVKVRPGATLPTGAVAVYGLADTYLIPHVTDKSRDAALDAWQKRADVVYAHLNYRIQVETPTQGAADGLILAAVNDTYAAQQWSLDRMGVYDAWDASKGDGVVVAVVDSGVTATHPDLTGKVLAGRNFVANTTDTTDDQGHGTHVAGIIGAATNNGQGVAGVGYNSRVLPVKVLDYSGAGYHDRIASGIIWAADNGAKVINMSFGGGQGSPTLEAAINYAWGRGAVLTCAAGNSNTATPAYPAFYQNCMAVGATDQSDRRAGFSNFGEWVDVGAPGMGVMSTVRSGVYQAWDGTSMAAPNVAGVAALVWAAHPTWSNSQVRAAIESGADALAGQQLGRGRVNAAAAVGGNPSPQPTLPPQPIPTQPSGPNAYAEAVMTLINQARVSQGLPALRYDARLSQAADFHNRWMRDNNCFAHSCPGEPDVAQRIRNAQYPLISAGENIGKGYTTPQAMMAGWMGSSGHRAAILNTYWPDMGCAYLAGGAWWSCEFARGSGEPLPVPTLTPLPWPAPPTPRPIPTPTAANGLPRGWLMWVALPQATTYTRYDYDTASLALVDAVYRQVCVGLASQGARCEWRRK